MDNSSLQKLARQFIGTAIALKPGETIWIDYAGENARALATACAAFAETLGGTILLVDSGSAMINEKIAPLSPEELTQYGQDHLEKMRQVQAFLRIGDNFDSGKITLNDDQRQRYKIAMAPSLKYRVSHTRWLAIAAPTAEFAADCGMDLPTFESFYRDVCLADYSRMTEAVKPLQKLMAAGRKVRLLSPAQQTDLSFSIEGIDAIPCTGSVNIPDGECFTAPVKDSVNGTIIYGPSKYDGQSFKRIKLVFKNGHIESAEAETDERTAALNRILDTDPGARYVGEFSINFNPYILHPTGSILFDEKIDGGIHMAMGMCYDEAYNGNQSAVHWDMVQIHRPDYGGGEVWIDDVLIRKDGLFVLPDLLPLNPESLKVAMTG